MFWAKLKLTAPSLLGGRFQAIPLSQASAALKKSIDESTPGLESYERLASVYHEYARTFCPDYVAFLRALAKRHGIALRSILDLACGAGTLTIQLARLAARVTAIDVSEPMLGAARKLCGGLVNVEFVRADYRVFCLNERFDVVVCACDSLNYLTDPAELVRVFRCVSQHLNPHGLFVFDALDDRGFRQYSGRYVPIRVNGAAFSIVLRYDPKMRVDNSLVIIGEESELHRRVPIEPDQVQRAADVTGLAVLDWFSVAGFGLLKYGGVRNFYVLRGPAGT
jgi:SAM-dependent methyltransferase